MLSGFFDIRCSGAGGARIGCMPLAPNPVEVIAMLDFVLLAIGVGFFVASILYVLACERM